MSVKVEESFVIEVELTAERAAKNQVELTKCEGDIGKGQEAFIVAAKAVRRIVKEQLFLPQFTDKTNYFADRWSMAKQDLLRYEHAGEVISILEENGYEGDRLPKNEGQCRELYAQSRREKQFDKSRVVMIWSAVVDGQDRITAKLIEATAKKLFRPEESEASSSVASPERAVTVPNLNSEDEPTFDTENDERVEDQDPSVPDDDQPAFGCSADVTVQVATSVLADAAEWLGVPVVQIASDKWKFTLRAADKEALVMNLASFVRTWDVIEVTIRFE